MELTVGENLVMRTLTARDVDAVFSVIHRNRAHLRRWLPWADSTGSPVAVEGVVKRWERQLAEGTDVVLGIFERGEYVGNIGLHDMERGNNSGMIGYWLAEEAQGRGIITSCVRKLTDHGFTALGLNRVYIYCAEPNAKSRAVPERLGFAFEGVMREMELLYGTYYDLCVYGMLRREWLGEA